MLLVTDSIRQLTQQVAFARRHFVDRAARPVTHPLRLFAVAGWPSNKEIDRTLHPHRAFLAWGTASLLEDDPLS